MIDIVHMRIVCEADWRTISTKSGLIKNLFNAKRLKTWKKKGTFQCSASEMMCLIPIVAYFIETIPSVQAALPLHVESWKALDELHRSLARAKLGIGSAADLARAIKDHGKKYHAAYENESKPFTPKYHWTKHLPEQFYNDKFLLDLFPTERINICSKPRWNQWTTQAANT